MTPNDDDRRAAARIEEMLPQLRRMEAATAFGGAGTSVRVKDAPYLIETLELALAELAAAERRGIERAAQVADEHACQHCAHISAAIRAITTEGADK